MNLSINFWLWLYCSQGEIPFQTTVQINGKQHTAVTYVTVNSKHSGQLVLQAELFKAPLRNFHFVLILVTCVDKSVTVLCRKDHV